MKKFRTYKNYTLIYDLEREKGGFVISVEKSGLSGAEKSTYVVHGEECELKSLVCRLWRCGVTPMSLVYILEDEGYLPKEVESPKVKSIPLVHIARRPRRNLSVGDNKMFVFDNSCYGTLCCEKSDGEA